MSSRVRKEGARCEARSNFEGTRSAKEGYTRSGADRQIGEEQNLSALMRREHGNADVDIGIWWHDPPPGPRPPAPAPRPSVALDSGLRGECTPSQASPGGGGKGRGRRESLSSHLYFFEKDTALSSSPNLIADPPLPPPAQPLAPLRRSHSGGSAVRQSCMMERATLRNGSGEKKQKQLPLQQ